METLISIAIFNEGAYVYFLAIKHIEKKLRSCMYVSLESNGI
jgi:hypothetical protein